MKSSVDGLVIWEVKTGEADRVVTILTANGLITAYARGSLRPKNKLTSPTSLLAYSNFELFSGRGMYNIDDAVNKTRFLSLFTDVERYAFAAYFCELLKYLAPIDDDAGEYLSLMLNTLHLLNEGKKDALLIKPVFELRLMALAGYMPDLAGCAGCGRTSADAPFFDINGGIWYCERCAKELGKSPNMPGSLLTAMRHILQPDARRIFSFELPKERISLLNEITSRYVVTHIERTLNTMDFLNAMIDD